MKHNRFLVILCLLVAALFLSGCSASPAGTVRSFYNAIDKGDYQKATSMMSSRVLNMVGPEKIEMALEQQVANSQQQNGIKSIKTSNERIYNDRTALVDIEIEMGDGSRETDTVHLVKEDKEWKIDLNK